MKKKVFFIVFIALCVMTFFSYSQISRDFKIYRVDYEKSGSTSYTLNYTVGEYKINTVIKNGVTYSQLVLGQSVVTTQKGFAELPIINATLQLSASKNVTLKVTPGEYIDYELNQPLLPSRGVIYRNQDPSAIPYETDPASLVDAWYPGDLSTNTDPFIFRDVRGTNIYVYPFQYNAVKKVLRVYKNVTVQLIENNTTPVNPLPEATAPVCEEMNGIYESLFMNYQKDLRWNNEVGEFGELLVIYTSRDKTVIQPYISWKKQMGFKVTEKEVTVGTNVKQTVKDAYTANNKILYVQLVGDWADIKCDLGAGDNSPMDMMLGCVKGTDNYPDICTGRFSAGSTTDVTTQVNKTVKYEKQPLSGGTWYKGALGIASDQGSGMGDDGEIDYTHIENIWLYRLKKFTYTTQYKAYDPGATASMVSTPVNAGIGIINYCGHGANNQFVTTGFSSTNVSSLTNGDKLPFIISVACVNGEFDATTCFAEYWLRKSNGGAIATLMATINLPWTPPMKAQDYMNDILTGGRTYGTGGNPGSGTTTDHGKTHFSSIVLNGDVLMYAEDNSTESLQTMQSWTVFGDVALQVRTDTPKILALSTESVTKTSFTTKVTVGGTAFKDALVSIWDGTNQPFSGLTDASGNVTIAHTLAGGTAAKLTVTGFNLIPFMKDVTITYAVDIEENESPSFVSIYPNPGNGQFTLSLADISDNISVQIINLQGQQVYQEKISEKSTNFDLSGLSKGCYTVKIITSGEVYYQKVIIE